MKTRGDCPCYRHIRKVERSRPLIIIWDADEPRLALPSENVEMHNSMHTTIRDHWCESAPSDQHLRAPTNICAIRSTFARSDPTFLLSNQHLRALIDDPRKSNLHAL
jgi:hypothetical protein